MAWQSAQTTLQVKWSSICNELHINETPHLFIKLTLVYLQDKIKCLLTWQDVKHKQTTLFRHLNEAGKITTTSPENPHEHV